ncbi:MAG: type II toxin-antitoxin system VapC family toxin [Gammaproteobacteria bacterium]|nr:type II toxin-antitoxin system VapC family toxin [Gammaproteobacteria bacterium]MCY4343670.1 type II toxin-antitoxin system VapC family toxin [Gammaproteobacteria bacterium]
MTLYLLDTHVLLWAASEPQRLPEATRALLDSSAADLMFSTASLWEVAIKRGLGREDFRVEPRQLRIGLLDNDYQELPIRGDHALAVDLLPPLHRDPFDRMLLAQAHVEGATLVTADRLLAQYPGPIERI